MIKLSLIVPIYNIEDYLEKCLDSLIKIKEGKIEIILVNDGSTDGSLDLCLKYRKKDNRIKIINKKNGGLSDARNKGLKEANGEFIWFIDGDDYISDVDSLFKYLNKDNDIIVFNYNEVRNNKVIKKTGIF